MTSLALNAGPPTLERGQGSATTDDCPLDEVGWLARLLERTCPRGPALATSRALLDRFGGLAAVAAADASALRSVCGLEAAAIADLKLARQLGILLIRSEVRPRPVIGSWTSLNAYVRVALSGEPREQVRVLFLDKRNGLMRDELICAGTVDHAPVYPREVMRRALELSASALILVHNHPSGDPTPSRADIDMTRQIVAAARVFMIEVHDHLIVGRASTASFKSLGLM